MNNREFFSIFWEEEFRISVCFERAKLFEMIRSHRGEYRDVRLCNREEILHLSRMIDPIFEYEVARIRTKESKKSLEKYSDPKERILATRFRTDDSERESVFPIIVIFRSSDTPLIIYFPQKTSDIRSLCGFSDRTRHADDIWLMSIDDEFCEKTKKKEK